MMRKGAWLAAGIAGVVGASGVAVYMNRGDGTLTNLHLPELQASWTTNYTPSVKWDFNWDHRQPSSFVKPSKNTPEDDNRYNEEIQKYTPKTTRHLFLIRHGQYNLQGKTDKEKILTALGRQQAEITGKRLQQLGLKWDKLIISTMTRAQETAEIISEQSPEKLKRKDCSLLEEGAPIVPEPPVGHWRPEAHQFFQDGARIEAAFRKYVHRNSPKKTHDTYSIVVCHANVIRYFVCRALQFPPEAWLRISLNHASITWISIQPNGRVSLRCLGDTGHMDPKVITST